MFIIFFCLLSNIELSDDESDCHPNIDKDSWFRLKHRTRVEVSKNFCWQFIVSSLKIGINIHISYL